MIVRLKPGLTTLEWFAVAMALLLLTSWFLYDYLVQSIWLLGALIAFGLWFIAVLGAIIGIGEGLIRRDRAWRRFAPAFVLVIALLLVSPVSSIGRWTLARLYLARHAEDFGPATAGGARSMRYIEGVPDGGRAIIHSPRQHPATFSSADMAALTGERIRDCQRLRNDDYLCGYD
ncbi:hypothetical protein [Sphingomonas sp. 32-62-10]